MTTEPASAPNPQGADELPGACGDPRCPGHEHAHGSVHDAMAYEAGEDVAPWVRHHHCTPHWPAAAVGVPDEPGDDDFPTTAAVLASLEDIERFHDDADMQTAAGVARLAFIGYRNRYAGLLATVERLRAAAPASEDDERRRTRLARERLVSAIDAHVAKTHEPLPEGVDPAIAAHLFSGESVELLLKAAELLRSGSPPPTPAPTRDRLIQAITDSYSTNPPGIIERAADAVLALLSEPAPIVAEPPSGGGCGGRDLT